MYINLLTKIKNAQHAKKEVMKTHYSNMDMAITELLAKQNYIESAAKKGRAPKRIIEIKLKYIGKEGAITGIKFLSKPSRRLYAGYKELRLIKQGYGTAFISTSKGIMTYQDARKQKLGGEVLFEIW